MPGSRKPRAICHHFRNKGTCKFGASCRFSHEVPDGDDITVASGPSRVELRSEEGKQIRRASHIFGALCELPSASRDREQRKIFYKHAVSLLDSNDDGITQETVTKLAANGGLAFICQSAENIASSNSTVRKTALLKDEILPMLKILSHPKICDSAVLEQQMATLHGYFIGVSGMRMATVFGFVLEHLSETWDLALAECGLVTLAKVVDCNTANIVDERLRNIVSSFGQLLADNGGGADSFEGFQTLKSLNYLKRRLRIGETIPVQGAGTAVASSQPTFTLTRDLPGELSRDGPRHDNDHQDITNIKILPTMDEISSPREDYLPTTDPSQGHLSGIHWLIDRHFRLLRKDTVGQLTDAVHAEFSRIRGTADSPPTTKKSMARTPAYPDACIEDIRFDVRNGIELLVSFPQPTPVRKLSAKKREEWWQSSKRLQPGALICMLNPYGRGSVLFCSVGDFNRRRTENPQKPSKPVDADAGTPDAQPCCPWDDPQRAFLPLTFVEPDNHNIGRATRWFQGSGCRPRRVLVEFPGVLFASFEATLATLQDIFRSPQLPFAEILAPGGADDIKAIPPPQYAKRPGFSFDLSSITTNESELRLVPGQDFDIDALESNTSLDPSQATAVVDMLSRSLALVEGPPGTGKSYTGETVVKILLANREAAKLGPILVVCYTNHALDQILEHLHNGGVGRILRIGSRSKSEILGKLNLREVARNADRTKRERDLLRNSYMSANRASDLILELLHELRNCDSPAGLRDYLKSKHSNHHATLFDTHVDQDGFTEVAHRRDQGLERWLRGGSRSGDATRPVEVLDETPLHTMTQMERRSLHNHWMASARNEIVAKLLSEHQNWQNAKTQDERVYREVKARCLGQAEVIGMTTTGLARNAQLLRKVNCKVVLCEEAGEVLESHLLTALLPSIEHAILIGDHLQLRPQIQNYDLQSTNPAGRKFSLDVSLFERLIEPFMDNDPRVPHGILLTQRRMHPSISALVRNTLYPDLEDAENVHNYPSVAGLKKRLFWLHHENEEQGKDHHDPTSTSISNKWEAAMIVALITHLVKQGKYSQREIAVVVPYLAQLRLLRPLFEAHFQVVLNDRDTIDLEEATASDPTAEEAQEAPAKEKKPLAAKASLSKAVRLATVDNFQGEEASIIVISLVRSNSENKAGFLRIENRINVLLSRAQHGMYIIGNANTAGSVDMWAKVLRILKEGGNFGTALELQCPRHPDRPLLVSEPDHFAQLCPDGGCNLPCDTRLKCGHKCLGRCHSDLLHGIFKCMEPCPRQRKECDHACPLPCGTPCVPKCLVQLDGLDITLACGHRATSAKCWEAQDPATIVCHVSTEKTVPGCGHFAKVPCCSRVDNLDYKCRAKCSATLPCGHECNRQCCKCRTRKGGKVTTKAHSICVETCGRKYTTCNHSCRSPCHDGSGCKPCNSPCDARCSHSKCGKKCHDPCAVCAEQTCASRCPHSQCSMPCAAPCDWIPCSKRCAKKLSCGHQCPSLCGEPCPKASFCQECATPDILSTIVDLLEMREYREIDLDQEPCIFLTCKHIFTAITLDGQMELSKHYQMSSSGQPTALASSSMPLSEDTVKVCPQCRGSLRNIARYGRIIRRALLDETSKRFIAWSTAEFAKVGSYFLDCQERLDIAATETVRASIGRHGKLAVGGGQLEAVTAVVDWVGDGYFTELMKSRRNITKYSSRVRHEEQPFRRVADFVTHAKRTRKDMGHFSFDESVMQVKGDLQARALLLRCDLLVLKKFMELWSGAEERKTQITFDLSEHKKDCKDLFEMAQKSVHPKEVIEGFVFQAQFLALERGILLRQDGQSTQDRCAEFKAEAEQALAHAREFARNYPGSAASVQADIEATSSMLKELVFYSAVSTRELRTVFQAMGFSTGHWYTCVNGHPFTIGECGMPMELASCPECGQPVGGQQHRAVDGVARATEMEAIGTGIGELALGGQ